MSKRLHVHFICTGNIYRSRLAEAYLRSKRLPNITVSSSGTKASLQNKGAITWYAQRLLLRNQLIPYMSDTWRNTIKQDVEEADIVIFIGKNNYRYCKENYSIPKQYEIWKLPDFDDTRLNGNAFSAEKELEYLQLSEKTFHEICKKVDQLVATYLSPALYSTKEK